MKKNAVSRAKPSSSTSGKKKAATKTAKVITTGTKAKRTTKASATAKKSVLKKSGSTKLTADSKPRASKVQSKSPATSGHERAEGNRASELIEQRIQELGDWRGPMLGRMRSLILEADPEMTEEWKWMGTPVWSHGGNVCTGETYKQVVKLTFARGASLDDPHRLFNSSLEGNTRRAIDIREGEALDAEAFKALIKAAVAENLHTSPEKTKSVPKTAAKSKLEVKETQSTNEKNGKSITLLSGGNPQIAKADGDAPVQAYIAAMPGWKSDIGRRVDALITKAVPSVSKAVKWNSPFYGIDGQGWFLSFHVFTRYVKVTFFNGAALKPAPSGCTERSNDARWIDIHEGDELNEAQMENWVKQAAELPGWTP